MRLLSTASLRSLPARQGGAEGGLRALDVEGAFEKMQSLPPHADAQRRIDIRSEDPSEIGRSEPCTFGTGIRSEAGEWVGVVRGQPWA